MTLEEALEHARTPADIVALADAESADRMAETIRNAEIELRREGATEEQVEFYLDLLRRRCEELKAKTMAHVRRRAEHPFASAQEH